MTNHDSTGTRKVRKGQHVLMGPALWRVLQVQAGHVWLEPTQQDGSSIIVRPCSAVTVYDPRSPHPEPAGPADVPLMEQTDHDHASDDHQ